MFDQLDHLFILNGNVPTNAIKGAYHPLLVLFSYIVASAAAYVAIHILTIRNNEKLSLAQARL